MAKKKKKAQKSENPLKTFQDLHSAMADLAAHYIPRNEIKGYFTSEELEGVQKKPSYSVTPDERGLVERVVFRLVEKKDKEDGTGEASASESILRAARDDIPKILVEAEDLAGIDPSNINPHNVQPFLKNAAETIAMYLLNNEVRLRKYDETAFIDALNNIFTIGEHVETQVRHACKRKINQLEGALHDAEAANAVLESKAAAEQDKEVSEDYVAQLEAGNAALTEEKQRLEAEKSVLEEEQAELGPAYKDIANKNLVLTERASVLEKKSAELNQELAGLRKDYDAGLQEFAKANDKLNSLEDEKAKLQSDLAQTIKYKQAEIKELQEKILAAEHDQKLSDAARKELQERLMYAEHDQKLSDAARKELQERLMYAEHEYMQELDNLQGQLNQASDDILTLSEKSACLEQERDEAKEDSAQMREAYDALFAQYRARIGELGDSVAEWYAFTERAFAQNAGFNDNEQLKELRSRGKKLAVLVSDLVEEAKSGSRTGRDRKDINSPWHEPEEAPLPTLEDADARYKQTLETVKSEHQREVWCWMHALQANNAPYELKQEVYAKFLSTNPEDNLIKCVAHNNLGNIFYENRQDYQSARSHYKKAVAAVEQELVQNPENKVAVARLAEARKNLESCEQKISAA